MSDEKWLPNGATTDEASEKKTTHFHTVVLPKDKSEFNWQYHVEHNLNTKYPTVTLYEDTRAIVPEWTAPTENKVIVRFREVHPGANYVIVVRA